MMCTVLSISAKNHTHDIVHVQYTTCTLVTQSRTHYISPEDKTYIMCKHAFKVATKLNEAVKNSVINCKETTHDRVYDR